MKSLGAWIPKPPAIIDGNQVGRSYCTAGLHLLNPSLVMNHLVQYEAIVNCRLGCERRRRACEYEKRRNQRNMEITDVRNETQAAVHSRATNRGKRVARHWHRGLCSGIL